MSCCGSLSIKLQAANRCNRPAGTEPPARPMLPRQFVVCFEYVGYTGLTVVGGATARHYRFDRRGDRVMVDPRDRLSLASLGCLRQV
jgi:hypothetical protein